MGAARLFNCTQIQTLHALLSLEEEAGAMSFHEAFGVDGYRTILKDKLGFGEADATMACDILLESAPVLVQKNVITLNQAFVSHPFNPQTLPLPRVS